MSEEGQGFLQHTTSQLLHQQEALRRRREVLERENSKPPAMRFGTPTSAPHSSSRSPAPPVSEREGNVNSTAPLSAERSRAISRDTRSAHEVRQPMQFSLSYRPSPMPTARAKTSISPTPSTRSPIPPLLESSSATASTTEAAARRRSFSHRHGRQALRSSHSRTPPPNPPAPRDPGQLARSISALREKAQAESRGKGEVRVEILVPHSMSLVAFEEEPPRPVWGHAQTKARRGTVTPPPSLEGEQPQQRQQQNPQPQVALHAHRAELFRSQRLVSSLQDSYGEEKHARREGEDEEQHHKVAMENRDSAAPLLATTRGRASGITPRLTNEFPLPRISTSSASMLEGLSTSFTPSRIAQLHMHGGVSQQQQQEEEEFPTPRPVTRTSVCLPPPPPLLDDNSFLTEMPSAAPSKQAAATSSSSPAPTPAKVLASFEASTEKRCCVRPTPEEAGSSAPPLGSVVVTFDTNTEAQVEGKDDDDEANTCGTPKRTTPSPIPTTEQVMQSVLRSAEKRKAARPSPCSGDRSESRKAVAQSVGSPLPTPEDTQGVTPKRPCGCERPTPTSISARLARSSRSPCPTTENLIDSFNTVSQEKRKRSGHTVSRPHLSEPGEERQVLQESDEEQEECVDSEREVSPNLTPRHVLSSIDMSVEKKRRIEADSRNDPMNRSTPSPVPTEKEIAESLLASADKRRCARPTPPSRDATEVPLEPPSVTVESRSPHPTSAHLLSSVQLFVDAEERRAQEGLGGSSSSLSRAAAVSHLDATVSSSGGISHSYSTMNGLDTAATNLDVNTELPRNNDFASPALTPQHIHDSFSRAVDERKLQGRSGAQDPQRCDGNASTALASPMTTLTSTATSSSGRNAFASPAPTAENVEQSLQVLQGEAMCADRSAPVPRTSTSLHVSSSSSATEEEAEEAEATRMQETVVTTVVAEETVEAAVCQEAAAFPPSPAFSDPVLNSAMFYECVSAPPTPANAYLPAEFFQLQRDVQAISEGRVRSTTPPALLHKEAVSPTTTATGFLSARAAIPSQPSVSTPQPTLAPASSEEATKNHEEKEGEMLKSTHVDERDVAVEKRNSTVLVGNAVPTRSPRPLIQHPHLPMPEDTQQQPEPCPVRVPRTPTPPPLYPTEQEKQQVGCEAARGALPAPLSVLGSIASVTPPRRAAVDSTTQTADTESRLPVHSNTGPGTSPLPRPVTLSSQVRLIHQEEEENRQRSQQVVPSFLHQEQQPALWHRQEPRIGSRSNGTAQSNASLVLDAPTPGGAVGSASRHRQEAQSYSVPLSFSPQEGRSTPYPRDVPLDVEGRDSSPMEPWEHRVEDDDQIFAISPQGNVVVRVTHVSEKRDGFFGKRSRSESPTSRSHSSDSEEYRDVRRPRKAHVLPDIRGSLVDEEKKVPMSQSPQSPPGRRTGGSGGRRSAAQQLLDMLPSDVATELGQWSSIHGSEGGRHAVIATFVKEEEEADEQQFGGIAARVSQRHSQALDNDDDGYDGKERNLKSSRKEAAMPASAKSSPGARKSSPLSAKASPSSKGSSASPVKASLSPKKASPSPKKASSTPPKTLPAASKTFPSTAQKKKSSPGIMPARTPASPTTTQAPPKQQGSARKSQSTSMVEVAPLTPPSASSSVVNAGSEVIRKIKSTTRLSQELRAALFREEEEWAEGSEEEAAAMARSSSDTTSSEREEEEEEAEPLRASGSGNMRSPGKSTGASPKTPSSTSVSVKRKKKNMKKAAKPTPSPKAPQLGGGKAKQRAMKKQAKKAAQMKLKLKVAEHVAGKNKNKHKMKGKH